MLQIPTGYNFKTLYLFSKFNYYKKLDSSCKILDKLVIKDKKNRCLPCYSKIDQKYQNIFV